MNRIAFLFLVFIVATEVVAQKPFWKSMGLTNTFSPHIAVDSKGTLFAATYGSGLFRSTDAGFSWTQVTIPTFPFFHGITVAPNDDIYISGAGALYRSTNSGQTWGFVVFSSSSPTVNDVLTISENTVLAATYVGVFKSTDRGLSWRAYSQGLPDATILSLASDSSGNLFAGLDNEGVFFSSNEGVDWSPRRVGIEKEIVYDIEADPTGQLYLATLNGVYKSQNAGLSWTPSNAGITNRLARSLAIEPNGTTYVGTLGGGTFLSKNGGQSWDSLSTDLAIRHVMSISIVQGDVVYAGTNTGGLYRLIKASEIFAAPGPLSPTNQANQVTTTPTLSWTRSVAADNYIVQISTDSLFQSNVLLEHSTADLLYPLPPINHSRQYYWRVFGANKYWRTIPSSTYSFVTIDPSDFSLMQNYPNPFNSGTTIQFSIPRPSMVHCELYSITGQHVSTLFSQFTQPGDYSVFLNSANLATGTYIYRLRADNYIDIRKLTVIK